MNLQRKQNWLWLFILLMIFSLITGCSSQNTLGKQKDLETTDKEPKEIRLGYQVSPNGELLAKALGLLEKKYPNIKISWIKFDSGRDVNNAMASGSIDFGLVGTPPGSIGIADKLPYKIYYLHDIIGESEALVAKKGSGIKSLKDLKGKKVATTFSSTSHYSLLKALEEEKIDPKKEGITILDMQAPDIDAAWKRNDIDAAYIWQPIQTQLLQDGGKRIISSKDLAKKGIITGEFGVVNKNFAKKYPGIVKGYISVLDKAVHYYHKQPKKSANVLSKELGLSPEKSLTTMKQIIWLDASQQTKYFGSPGHPGKLAHILKDTANFMAAQKDIKSAPNLDTYQQALLSNLYK
ncbi:aliphatic sulfonate ABC transporter substrate-binding protein [Bacillus ginsengihumi]|uniref:Aliphatic sulfonate ABC transporter substrate-binding protein n=1 Tax=Heyndrickxia ginsengihumi TaxID=363870 RepID=A0A0A6VD48_9BACI|nr:aliphatic sulfonate ABC transporter substrate-binding protein [Heyndrickxia ginsengihumi]KHD84449.1 taurine ABC transporter substrate-binding protein [Heyndrickxia ginsengihumi]MBE6185245.1 aliphatic sulfonate ABC transporter substrate-binding protein [Bacillus sp. (in: firmicutes)]MCM3025075.1 aliphatic sulfonate ABC transporter substrate-binding protein [Heyndrickxia ginsengihumi]NEY21677.1 aliphatic sulfonate ABC transporter substrate-binding protein [Heyndrickxia ginsengihumi]